MRSTTPSESPAAHPASTLLAGRRWSLALRLTIQMALAALLVVAIVSAVLHVALTDSLRREQDQFLNNKLRILQKQITSQPRVVRDLREEVEEDFAPHQYAQVFARVLNQNNQVVAESPTMDALLPASVFPPAKDLTAAPLEGIDFRSTEGREFRWIAGRTGKSDSDGIIQVALDNTSGNEMLARYRKQLAIVICTVSITCIVVGFFISRRALRPLREISATVARIRPTSLGERIELHGLPTELHEVAVTLNGMLDRLKMSFERLSEFSVDLAHELRTPLNNLLGLMETTLESDRTPAEYRETLASALEESVRLHRIIDGLLFIARSDDPRTQIRREKLEIRAELRRLTEMYHILASDRGVQLSLDCAEEIGADLDKTLLQRAIDNLIANAMAHTPSGGCVTIRALAHDDTVEIQVRDTGSGIPAEQLPRVFDRLYRGDTGPQNGSRGLGLGLSIVRGIMSLHGGIAELHSTPGEGTTVSLRFPRHTPATVNRDPVLQS